MQWCSDLLKCFLLLKTPSSSSFRNGDTNTSTKDSTLLAAISTSNFLRAISILKKTSALMMPLSQGLQSIQLDLLAAVEIVNEVADELGRLRNDELIFSSMFHKATQLADVVGSNITVPRIVSRQRKPLQHFSCNARTVLSHQLF